MHTSTEKIQTALRKAESILAEAFMEALPQHYFVCEQMLREPGDTTAFSRKVGRYLLAYDPELGESPVSAVTAGRSDLLLQQMAKRTNIDLESISIVKLPVGATQEVASCELLPVYLAYCDYYATGEGATILVGAGNTPNAARDAFLRHAPEFFHQGLIEDKFEASSPPETRRAARLISQSMLDFISSNLRGVPQLYATLHYNLS